MILIDYFQEKTILIKMNLVDELKITPVVMNKNYTYE